MLAWSSISAHNTNMARKRKPKQLEMSELWGEKKRRKRRRKPDRGVSHWTREGFKTLPVHVTMKLRRGLPSMRQVECYKVLWESFSKGKQRPGRLEGGTFRLVHYTIQDDHLHFIMEARDRESLSRGVQGLAVRIAKGLNRLWKRKGKVFADRYHDHILRTPREVKNALRYVLQNIRKHYDHIISQRRPDGYSSGPWFEGWKDFKHDGKWICSEGPVARARTWLLTRGWRKHGRLSLRDAPGLTP